MPGGPHGLQNRCRFARGEVGSIPTLSAGVARRARWSTGWIVGKTHVGWCRFVTLAACRSRARCRRTRGATPTSPKSRDFLFTYAATVTGLPPGRVARVWLPTPSDDADQTVTLVRQQLPARPHETQEPKYGNRILYFEPSGRRRRKDFPLADLPRPPRRVLA